MPKDTPVTNRVIGGPTTQQVRKLNAAPFGQGRTELDLAVGDDRITVALEKVQASTNFNVPANQCLEWTIVGWVVTRDNRLAKLGFKPGSRLVSLYNSETQTGIAW